MTKKRNIETSSLSASDSNSSLGIDNVCLNMDKYLDELEKPLEITNIPLRRSSSHGFLSSNSTDERNWSTVSKSASYKRYSLDMEQDKKNDCDKNGGISIDTNQLNVPASSIRLVWRNLTYTTKKGKSLRRKILDRQNGEIYGGQLTAIIGPSGAGKSTLLESLAGRRRIGLKGEVFVVYDRDYIGKSEKVKVSFIAQREHVIGVLTVRETLLFATRLKNYNRIKSFEYHVKLVESILKELTLDVCAEVRVSKISGGQMKRLSFAMELISGPDILMLDEPTSGLDSSSAYQCIQLLRKLTDLRQDNHSYKPPAIMCSIHQPSARVLNIFHQVYVLSNDGRCLYSGSPYYLLSHLSKFDFHCPQFHNPADYIIEIASGDYGLEPINKLAITESNRQLAVLNEGNMLVSCNKYLVSNKKSAQIKVKVTKVIEQMKNEKFPQFLHFWLLLKRTYLTTIRDPKLTWFRISQAIFIGLLMGFLYDYPIGKANGCIPFTHPSLSHLSSPPPPNGSEENPTTQDNIAFIFFITLFTVMASMMPTVLTFPSEVAVLVQERNNGWYSCWTYYWTKVIADTPYQVFITIMFCSIVYPMTGQIWSEWRFGLFNLIAILVASIAQCVGMLFGTIYVNSVQNAVFMAPLSMAPVFLMSGFFGKISKIPIFLKPIAYVSYVRYAFEAFLVALYGFERCSDIPFSTAAAASNDYDLSASASNRITEDSDPENNHHYPKHDQSTHPDNQLYKNVPKYSDKIPKTWSDLSYDQLNYMKNNNSSGLFNNTQLYNSYDNFYGDNGPNNFEYRSGSFIINHFELDDDTLWQNIVILISVLIFLRFLSYVILLIKTNEKK